MLLHVLDIKAMVIYRTVLHDLSVLAIRRTIQINSRPTEIIIGLLGLLEAKWRFACVMNFISANQTI